MYPPQLSLIFRRTPSFRKRGGRWITILTLYFQRNDKEKCTIKANKDRIRRPTLDGTSLRVYRSLASVGTLLLVVPWLRELGYSDVRFLRTVIVHALEPSSRKVSVQISTGVRTGCRSLRLLGRFTGGLRTVFLNSISEISPPVNSVSLSIEYMKFSQGARRGVKK